MRALGNDGDASVMLSATVISPPITSRFGNCIYGSQSEDTSYTGEILWEMSSKETSCPHLTSTAFTFSIARGFHVYFRYLNQSLTLAGICCHGYLRFAVGLLVMRIQLLRASSKSLNFCTTTTGERARNSGNDKLPLSERPSAPIDYLTWKMFLEGKRLILVGACTRHGNGRRRP